VLQRRDRAAPSLEIRIATRHQPRAIEVVLRRRGIELPAVLVAGPYLVVAERQRLGVLEGHAGALTDLLDDVLVRRWRGPADRFFTFRFGPLPRGVDVAAGKNRRRRGVNRQLAIERRLRVALHSCLLVLAVLRLLLSRKPFFRACSGPAASRPLRLGRRR